MSQKEIEIILTRQLASYLAMPAFLVDTDGTLIYYNEAAEQILGRRFAETFEMPLEEWTTQFKQMDREGNPIAPDDLPLVIALREKRPAHSEFSIQGLDERTHHIEVTAFPLIGQVGTSERHLGAIALFWEVKSE